MFPLEEIEAERKRQIEVEGWTLDHDDGHVTEDLMNAALAYKAHATGTAIYRDGVPTSWPWEKRWWKPKTPRRDLVRAGALCLAERERWQRDGFPEQALPQMVLEEIVGLIAAIDAGPPDVMAKET